jgi:hypothetical protein
MDDFEVMEFIIAFGNLYYVWPFISIASRRFLLFIHTAANRRLSSLAVHSSPFCLSHRALLQSSSSREGAYIICAHKLSQCF